MVPLLIAERGVIGVGGLLVLLLIEQAWPFAAPADRRWRRWLINGFIIGSNTLILSLLLGGLLVFLYHQCELSRIGVLHRLGVGGWWNAGITIVALDSVTYFWHRAYHGLPLLWRMHRVHHSDLALDVTTSGRFHVTEMLCSAVFRLGVIAALGASVPAVVMFEIIFGICNQFEHANLRLPPRLDAWLRWVIVTPDMHRIHHSQRGEQTNSNYSTIFSWWDRLFGTYRWTEDQQALRIGLPEYPRAEDVTIGRVLALPFGASCEQARRRVEGERRLAPTA